MKIYILNLDEFKLELYNLSNHTNIEETFGSKTKDKIVGSLSSWKSNPTWPKDNLITIELISSTLIIRTVILIISFNELS